MKHRLSQYFCPMLIDHFAVLGLEPSATPDEIKSAYRQLARQHHPDLNPHDFQTTDRFRAIQQAYEILSKPHLRAAYLEKRWYAQYRNERLRAQPLTLDGVLRECIELERFVASLDDYRMDRAGLHQHILQRIRDWQSVHFSIGEKQPIEQILQLLTRCAVKLELQQAETLQETLENWLRSNGCDHLLNDQWLIKKRRFDAWQKRMPLVMLLLTIILSLVIWMAGR